MGYKTTLCKHYTLNGIDGGWGPLGEVLEQHPSLPNPVLFGLTRALMYASISASCLVMKANLEVMQRLEHPLDVYPWPAVHTSLTNEMPS